MKLYKPYFRTYRLNENLSYLTFSRFYSLMHYLFLSASDLELQYFLARRLHKEMKFSLLLNLIFCIGESKRFDRKLILDDDTTVRFLRWVEKF